MESQEQLAQAATSQDEVQVFVIALPTSKGETPLFEIKSSINNMEWKTKRSYQQFIALHQKATLQLPKILLSRVADVQNTLDSLQLFLKGLINILKDEIWNFMPVLEFLDDSYNHSPLATAQTKILINKVRVVEHAQQKTDARLDEVTAALQMVADKLAESITVERSAPSAALTESNLLHSVAHRLLNRSASPRFSQRFSIASQMTNESGTSISFDAESDSLANNNHSRRESHMTDASDVSQDEMFQGSDPQFSEELYKGKSGVDCKDVSHEASETHDSNTSMSKLFSTMVHREEVLSDAGSDAEGEGEGDLSELTSSLQQQPPGLLIDSIASHGFFGQGTPLSDGGDSTYSPFSDRASSWLGHPLFSAGGTSGLAAGSAPAGTAGGPEALLSSSPRSSTTRESVYSGSFTPFASRTDAISEAVDNLLVLLEPHDEQIIYRKSVRAAVGKHVRRVTNSKVMEIGLHGIHCFLPDDVLRLSPVIWKGNNTNWQTLLVDRLSRAQDGIVDPKEASLEDDGNRSVADINDNPPYAVVAEHAFSGALLSHATGDNRVQVAVDSVQVEVVPFQIMDLCMLAFIEEVSVLVGREDLFKKSLLLIRAWWVYETTSYIGCAMKHYLTDFTMCILVCAMFNQHHSRINHPFDALYTFLSMFSDLDWASNAISLQGIAPFASESDSQPPVLPASSSSLIGTQLLTKYSEAVRMQPTPVSSNRNSGQLLSPVDGSVAASGASLIGTIGDAINPNSSPVSQSNSALSAAPSGTLNGVENLSVIPSVPFERRELNIVNPFDGSNMITDKLNTRRAKRIIKVFQMGARNLQAAVRLGAVDQSCSTSSIHTFFRTTWSRFGSGWRPDVKGNMVSEPPLEQSDPKLKRLGWKKGDLRLSQCIYRHMHSPLIEHLWNQVFYCSFVLEGVVTEPALMAICSEILIDRGTLPVGEIGKILQELTAIVNLSNKLKEKFGGLKKFLERFPEQFVISTDHPFNPHVFMKKMLTAEDLEVISRGIVPPQLTAKFKKAAIARKQKASGSFIAEAPGGQWSPIVNVSVPMQAASNLSPLGRMSGPGSGPGSSGSHSYQGGGRPQSGQFSFAQAQQLQTQLMQPMTSPIVAPSVSPVGSMSPQQQWLEARNARVGATASPADFTDRRVSYPDRQAPQRPQMESRHSAQPYSYQQRQAGTYPAGAGRTKAASGDVDLQYMLDQEAAARSAGPVGSLDPALLGIFGAPITQQKPASALFRGGSVYANSNSNPNINSTATGPPGRQQTGYFLPGRANTPPAPAPPPSGSSSPAQQLNHYSAQSQYPYKR